MIKEIEPKSNNNDNTVFMIAFITKLFTSVAIMQLYERGRLSLAYPISKYIPGQIREKGLSLIETLFSMRDSPLFF